MDHCHPRFVRRTLPFVLAMAATGLLEGMGGVSKAADRVGVAFVRVEGMECLQPVVKVKDGETADYRAAQHRWLEENHPSAAVESYESVLVLPPDTEGENEPETVTHARDAFHLKTVDGVAIEVCFDVNVTTKRSKTGE